MRTFIVGRNAKAYNIVGSGKNIKLTEFKGTYIDKGRSFPGKIVFIRTSMGFLPMVKTMINDEHSVYYKANQVYPIENEKDKHAIPRAGEIAAFETKGKKPFGLRAGEIEGNINTAPQITEMMTGASGETFGVQAGQIWRNPISEANPYQVEGGDIENIAEVDSHIYSSFQGVVAGSMYDWNALDQAKNPTQVEAGEIEGNINTRPESFMYANGDSFMRAYRYPNLRHYSWASVKTDPALVDYSESYPQYIDANFSGATGGQKRDWMIAVSGKGKENYKGVIAGGMHDWNAKDQIPFEHQVEAGEIQGHMDTRPESFIPINGSQKEGLQYADRYAGYWYDDFSGANGDFWKNLFGSKDGKKKLEKAIENKKDLSEDEMKELYTASNTKQSFSDWLKSDQAKNLASNAAEIATLIWNKKQQDKVEQVKNENQPDIKSTSKDSSNSESSLLNPITLGIIGLVVVGGIVAVVAFKGK